MVSPSTLPATLTTGEIIACLFGVPAHADEFEEANATEPTSDPDDYTFGQDIYGGDYGRCFAAPSRGSQTGASATEDGLLLHRTTGA